MVLERLGEVTENSAPLQLTHYPIPIPTQNEILIKVAACGVCHTELDEIEGRTPPLKLPMILGHQVVGRVESRGSGVIQFQPGDRVGVAWISSSCEQCSVCVAGKENLCSEFRATGRDAFGGYAEYMTISSRYAFPIPTYLSDIEAAPLLCAGAIGFRSLRLTGLEDGQNLGLTGFGASAHLVLRMVRQQFPNSRIFVFARAEQERKFAIELGATWSGESTAEPPEKLHAIIDTTPAWSPVVNALGNLSPGGRLVINAIRKEDTDKAALLQIDYSRDLWLEKEIKSVANITRSDVTEFLRLATRWELRPEVEVYSLEDANRAIIDLKHKRIHGAKVLLNR